MIKKIAFLLIIISTTSYGAELYEVIDEKVLEQVEDQVEWAEDQYDKLEEQYIKLSDTYTALTEVKDFNDAFEFVLDTGEDYWDWTPSIEDLEKMAEGGYQTGSLSDRIDYYNKTYGTAKTVSDFSDDPDSTAGHLKANVARSSRYGMGMSHEAFDKTEDFQEQYEKLLAEFPELESQKQSTDFGNRLELQMNQMMNELIKLQAIQVHQLSLDKKILDNVNEFNAHFINSKNPDAN